MGTVAPTKDYAEFLGEVVVHGEDIARVLDIELRPDGGSPIEFANFFTAKDLAVNSRSLVTGLRLEAADTTSAPGAVRWFEGTCWIW